MTDDERALANRLPVGCRMREGAKIISPERFVCGEYVWIGERVIVDASGGLEIGDHTTLSGCSIWSHSSAMANILMDNRSGNPYIVRSKTSIGSGCFIGGPSVIYPGVSIGNRCIVMPMSVVNSDVPDNTMVAGSPAKVIAETFLEQCDVGDVWWNVSSSWETRGGVCCSDTPNWWNACDFCSLENLIWSILRFLSLSATFQFSGKSRNSTG